MENPVQLTHRFIEAVDHARRVHVNLRKGTQAPYMALLLGVASLVLGETGHVPFPVTEDMAIAALLHDAVETCQVVRSFLSTRGNLMRRSRAQKLLVLPRPAY